MQRKQGPKGTVTLACSFTVNVGVMLRRLKDLTAMESQTTASGMHTKNVLTKAAMNALEVDS